MCQATKKFRALEVKVLNQNALTFAFDQDEVLASACRITAIEAYPPTVLAVAPSGAPVVSASVFKKASLNLQSFDGNNPITDLPLQRLDTSANSGLKFNLDTPALNVTKCFIKVGDTAGLVAGTSFVLGIHYEPK